eukprot:6185132-Pleurochrysis_carterae.AAC.1
MSGSRADDSTSAVWTDQRRLAARAPDAREADAVLAVGEDAEAARRDRVETDGARHRDRRLLSARGRGSVSVAARTAADDRGGAVRACVRLLGED